MSLVVKALGPLALVEDLGRPGYGHLGVCPSGAADRASHRLANALVGNAEGAATLEVLLGGLRASVTTDAVIALTGAPAAVNVAGRPVAFGEAVHVRAGDDIAVGAPTHGLRTYLAVRGGFAVAPVLGSRSSDPTTGLGPAPVTVGDELPFGDDTAGDVPGVDAGTAFVRSGDLLLRAVWGPRDDWFTDEARAAFTAKAWEVSAEGDRVGVRLLGSALERSRVGELASEGLVRGAIQVPANGQPIVFLADHPTTGGYPVIAVTRDEDVDHLAQARPGTRVRFVCERRTL